MTGRWCLWILQLTFWVEKLLFWHQGGRGQPMGHTLVTPQGWVSEAGDRADNINIQLVPAPKLGQDRPCVPVTAWMCYVDVWWWISLPDGTACLLQEESRQPALLINGVIRRRAWLEASPSHAWHRAERVHGAVVAHGFTLCSAFLMKTWIFHQLCTFISVWVSSCWKQRCDNSSRVAAPTRGVEEPGFIFLNGQPQKQN